MRASSAAAPAGWLALCLVLLLLVALAVSSPLQGHGHGHGHGDVDGQAHSEPGVSLQHGHDPQHEHQPTPKQKHESVTIPDHCNDHTHHRHLRIRLDPARIPKFVEQLPQPKRIFAYQSKSHTNTDPIHCQDAVPLSKPLQNPVSEFTTRILPSSFTDGPYKGRTLVWGYDGTYPGPTIESRRGIPMAVQYPNLLDPKTTKLHRQYDIDPKLLPSELNTTDRLELIPRVPGRPPLFRYVGPIPHVTHLHGSEVESASDGHPEAWYTYKYRQVGHAFIDKIHRHPQMQEAMTLWYHDHSMGMTRFTVYSGIAGFNLLRDPKNEPADLPNTQPYEMEIVLQDRDFDIDGQLMYIQPDEANAGGHEDMGETDTGVSTSAEVTHDHGTGTGTGHGNGDGNGDSEGEGEDSRLGQHEFFGDFIVVNGKTWPQFRVEPRRYRFRLLNGANARFFNLSFPRSQDSDTKRKVHWWIIGTEGGLLDHAAPLSSLLLAPAERADVMVDFSDVRVGDKIVWRNTAPEDFPSSARPDIHTAQVLQFKIIPLKARDTSLDPRQYECGGKSLRPNNPIVRLSPNCKVDLSRHITLVQVHQLRDQFIVPHVYLLNNVGFHAPSMETPVTGSTELWELINLTTDTHPIHLHLVQFQLLNRQCVDSLAYNRTYSRSYPGGEMIAYAGPPRPPSKEFPGGNPPFEPFLIGAPRPPPPEEDGWKDVIRSNPNQVTRFLVRYAPLDVPLGATQPGVNLYPFTPFGPSNVIDPLTGLETGHSYVWHCHMLDHEDNDMMHPYGDH